MCEHGLTTDVYVINKRTMVPVDACIAEEVRHLNERGIITLGSCCGHGKAGRVVEYENGFGRWKTYEQPPHVLLAEESVPLIRDLGYLPYPYYYADGTYEGVWQAQLKTGDIEKEGVR